MVRFLILPNELVMQAMVLEVAAYFVPDALRGVGSDVAVERVNVPTDPDLDQHRSAAMALL